MERIALLLDAGTRNMVMDAKNIARLEKIGTLTINEGGTDKETAKKIIKDATIAVTSWGSAALDEELLANAPDLKLLVHAAGSVKPVVTDALWDKGIRVTSSACVLSMGVSETALGLTIAASKNVFFHNANIHNGGWAEGKENIRELYDLTIGVIGGGWAGRHYIELVSAFSVNILLYDPFISEEKCAEMGVKKATIEELLSNSDIVSIHAPSIPETNHMINENTLKLMKKDAVLINTARGSIVDEKALYEYMKAGGLKYACLDVTDPEPPAVDNPLRTLPNVIFTPHLAGLASNGLKKIGLHVCEETEKFLKGERMKGEVTKEMLAKMA